MIDTFVFAPEIERNVVSICWHEPERIAPLLAHFDPDTHLTQHHLRIILSAIGLAYAELGTSDWGTVITVLRELRQLEAVGGLAGANEVYGHDGIPNGHAFAFDHYVELLKNYSLARPALEPVFHVSGGKGTLELNKTRRKDTDCDYRGRMRVGGKMYAIRAWIAPQAQFINLTAAPIL